MHALSEWIMLQTYHAPPPSVITRIDEIISHIIIILYSQSFQTVPCVLVAIFYWSRKTEGKKSTTGRRLHSDAKDDVIVVVVIADTRFSDMEESVRYRVNG